MMNILTKVPYRKRGAYLTTRCFWVVAVLVFSSCTRELDLPKIEAESKIVLVGELTGGEPALLRAGQSLPLAEGSSLKFGIIQDLQVQLTDNSNATQQLTGAADDKTLVLFTVPYKSTAALQPGMHYRLSAVHKTLGTATAEFTMPGAFTSSITDTAASSYAGLSVFEVGIKIDDVAGEKNYYVIEVVKQYIDVRGSFFFSGQWYDLDGNKWLYDSLIHANVFPANNFDTTFTNDNYRQPVYTTDPNTDNLTFGNALSPSRRILLRDQNFNGTSYATRILVDRSQFLATGFIDRGRIIITVKSVTEEYYNYLVSYEQTEPGLEPDQPLRLKGNVNNGLGIVGAVYLKRFTYFFDSWGY